MEEILWSEVYRPQTVNDLILPNNLKNIFQRCVDQGNVPNMILAGTPGVGKTSAARAMLTQLDADFIFINGSTNGNIDTLRNDIANFASSMSLTGARKYIIIDEADYMNPNSMQPGLRGVMDEFSSTTGFIFTCNYKNRIIEPLHSRCAVIDFKISQDDAGQMATLFMKRVMAILDIEGIKFEIPVLAEIIKKFFPDWRRTLNELQRYSNESGGKIDAGLFAQLKDIEIDSLIDLMKSKDYSGMKKWVADNVSMDQAMLFRRLYDTGSQYFLPSSIPAIVLVLGKYLYQMAFSADQEINTMCCLTEIMIEGEWR